MIQKRIGPRMERGLPTDHWKLSIEDYLASGASLYDSVKRDGFSPEYPVPVDPDFELLDGSHRVALALALGIDTIPVEFKSSCVWAPSWTVEWFSTNGMRGSWMDRIQADFKEMAA